MNDERERAREATRRRAREAYARGEAADDPAEAARWFERANRLARADHTIAFALAMLRLRAKDAAGAVHLLLPVARATDGREAWIALAIARHLQGLTQEAAHMLGETLSRHAIDRDDEATNQIANGIAVASGACGWAGLTADGHVLIRAVERGLDVAVTLDGTPCVGGIRSGDGLSSDITLPPGWAGAAKVDVQARGRGGLRTLIGDSIDVAALLRVDGVVEPDGNGGLIGWARTPNAAEHAVSMSVRSLAGRTLHRVETAARTTGDFTVPANVLPDGPVRVVDEAGRDLLGSPLDPGLEARAKAAFAALTAGSTGRATVEAAARFAPIPADFLGPPPAPDPGRRRGLAIVIPVYRGVARTLACLDSVERTVGKRVAIHVVDDSCPEPALVEALEARASARRIELHRHPGRANRGFPASANLGLVATAGRDVVLLNADTLVAGDWLARLRAAAYSEPDIGTATPLTNEGSIVGYPRPRHANDMLDEAGTETLHALAARANDGRTAELPTANGFCMFVRRDCLDRVGLLREDLFAQGYGEENDFCMRARHNGWRHVAALDVYVAHAGGVSFRAGREQLTRRNLALLNRLHPGYDALVARHIEADPLADARRRFDLARLDERPDAGPAVLLVTHQAGGGVERFIQARIETIRAQSHRPVVLRGDPEGERDDLCIVEPDAARGFPNLRFVLPAEEDALGVLLERFRPARIEVHHTLGHHPSITDLCLSRSQPIDVWLHDYAWFCPRIALIGPERTLCGEPPVETCRRCVAEQGTLLGHELGVDAVIAISARLFAGARRTIAASADAARRLERHFPDLSVEVEPWEGPVVPMPQPRPARLATSESPLVVAIPGAIGPEKGVELLIACARDAARRGLPIRFVVVGHTSDDDRLLVAGPIFVTGPYDRDEAEFLLRAQQADFAFLPAIWPETWSYALTECWRADLMVMAFDVGAQAERIRAHGGGQLLPLGLPPASVNDALLAYLQQADVSSSNAASLVEMATSAPRQGLVTPPHSARSIPPRATLRAKRTRDTAS
jgi:GT2 family glycosyltransferase